MTSASIRVLDHADIAEIARRVGVDVLMDEIIDRLAGALREHEPDVVQSQPRGGFEYRKPSLGLVEWMPAMELGRRVAIKTVAYHPSNPTERRLPSVVANTAMYDTTSGRLVALCDATLLTAMRTGAASAVATDVLAIDRPVRLGVIGCGAQAVTQVHAISRIRPVVEVVVFDADREVAETFEARLASVLPETPVRTSEDSESVVGEVDVLCTVTSTEIGTGPVFAECDVRPWLHVNAVGADFPGKTEVPINLLRRAFVVPDYLDQCRSEGECQQLKAEEIGPELPEVVRHGDRYRSRCAELTVFDSTGWAVEDLVAADVVFGHADRLGLGLEVHLHHEPDDPFDPYEFLREDRGEAGR